MNITVKDVDFSYDESTPVLHNINLVLDKPGLTCIIGPNGVGKSTLIRCLNKLLKPTSGNVTIDSEDVSNMSFRDLSKIMGYVPAGNDDFFPMTVLETVMMGRHPHQKWSVSTEEDLRIVYDTLVLMSVQHLAMRNFGELSAGQHQRVAIARGLAQRPEIMILDEPTSNLDIRHQLIVTKNLKDLADKNNMIVIMISHDLNISSKYADRVIIMSTPGIIYKSGTPQEVITEETIRYVYGVDCKIEMINDRPHVILLDALSDDEIQSMHKNE